MKIMAVDYGDARTGLAVCDRTEFLASPIGQIEEKSMAKVAEKIIYASREFDVGMIVIGLPKNMDGTEGGRAQKTRKLAKLVELGVQVPIVFWDERRTTVTAAAQLSEAGTFGKKRKDKLDAVSAAVILDSFLAWRKNHPGQQPNDDVFAPLLHAITPGLVFPAKPISCKTTEVQKNVRLFSCTSVVVCSNSVSLYPLQLQLLVHIIFTHRTQQIAPGDDAAQGVAVVHHGDKVLLHSQVHHLLEGGPDAHGGAEIAAHNVSDFGLFQLLFVGGVHRQDVAEKISLGDTAHISPLPVQHRNGGVAVVTHGFQALPHRVVLVQYHGTGLGDHNFRNVHVMFPHLTG